MLKAFENSVKTGMLRIDYFLKIRKFTKFLNLPTVESLLEYKQFFLIMFQFNGILKIYIQLNFVF